MPQNSQENTYAGVSFLLKLAWGLYLKRDSDTGVFLLVCKILKNTFL